MIVFILHTKSSKFVWLLLLCSLSLLVTGCHITNSEEEIVGEITQWSTECENPCWYNLTPGITRKEEFIRLSRTLEAEGKINWMTQNNFSGNTHYWSMDWPHRSSRITFEFLPQGTLREIGFSSLPITLKTLQESLESPDGYRASLAIDHDQKVALSIHYHDRGLVFSGADHNAEIQKLNTTSQCEYRVYESFVFSEIQLVSSRTYGESSVSSANVDDIQSWADGTLKLHGTCY